MANERTRIGDGQVANGRCRLDRLVEGAVIESEDLCGSLHQAGELIATAELEADGRAAGDLEAARELLRKWTSRLEAGEWAGRSVAAYPETPQRLPDGLAQVTEIAVRTGLNLIALSIRRCGVRVPAGSPSSHS